MRFNNWLRVRSGDFAFNCLAVLIALVLIALFGTFLFSAVGWLFIVLVLLAPFAAVTAVALVVYLAARWVVDAARGVFRKNKPDGS